MVARARRYGSERAESVAASNGDKYPIRGTFFVCCASVIAVKVSSAVVTKIESQPSFFNSHLVRKGNYLARTEPPRKVLLRNHKNEILRGNKGNYRRRIRLNDASISPHRHLAVKSKKKGKLCLPELNDQRTIAKEPL